MIKARRVIDLDDPPEVAKPYAELYEREHRERRRDLKTIARHEAFMLEQARERDDALAKLRVAEDKITELRKDLGEALDSLDYLEHPPFAYGWDRVREKWGL